MFCPLVDRNSLLPDDDVLPVSTSQCQRRVPVRGRFGLQLHPQHLSMLRGFLTPIPDLGMFLLSLCSISIVAIKRQA